MNYAPWISDNSRMITREESRKEYETYANEKSKERQYYRQNFLNMYPKSPVLHYTDYNIPDKDKFIKLFFNGHNVWYDLDASRKIIYQYGYGVGGVYQYQNGTSEYEYTLDCYKNRKPIDKLIMLDHLFDKSDNYRG